MMWYLYTGSPKRFWAEGRFTVPQMGGPVWVALLLLLVCLGKRPHGWVGVRAKGGPARYWGSGLDLARDPGLGGGAIGDRATLGRWWPCRMGLVVAAASRLQGSSQSHGLCQASVATTSSTTTSTATTASRNRLWAGSTGFLVRIHSWAVVWGPPPIHLALFFQAWNLSLFTDLMVQCIQMSFFNFQTTLHFFNHLVWWSVPKDMKAFTVLWNCKQGSSVHSYGVSV